jgi:hypothetical protein
MTRSRRCPARGTEVRMAGACRREQPDQPDQAGQGLVTVNACLPKNRMLLGLSKHSTVIS